jgi:hypothetical protein
MMDDNSQYVPSESEIQDGFKMNRFIAELGYNFTWGDSYFMVDKGEWFFQSDIVSECQMEAIKHSGVKNLDTMRWIQKAEETVKVFRKFKTSLVKIDAVDIILEEVRKIEKENRD